MRAPVFAAAVLLATAAPALAQSADTLWHEASKYYEMSQSGSASTNAVVRAALLEKAVDAALRAERAPDGAIPAFVASRRDIQVALGDAYVADKRWDRAALIFVAVKRDFTTPPADRQNAINYAHAVQSSLAIAIGARDELAMSRSVAEIDTVLSGRPPRDIYVTYLVSGVPALLDNPDFNLASTSQTPDTLARVVRDSNHALSITRMFATAYPADRARQNQLLSWLFRNGTLRNDVPTLDQASELAENLDQRRLLNPDLRIVRDALRQRCEQRPLGGHCYPEPQPH